MESEKQVEPAVAEEEKGTSGPDGKDEEVVIKEEEPVAAPEPVNPTEAALAAMGDLKVYKRGELVEGTIVQVLDDALVIDIGTKTEGMIKREEIGIGPSPDLSSFAVGDKVKSVVISEDEEGAYHLSKRKADQMLVWEKVEESQKDGTRISASGFRAVKGGLLVDIGTIAFLPQSLVDIRRVDDMEPYVGQKFDVRVIEYDREAKPHPKIVVSRRAVIEEDLTRERDGLYDSLEPGAVIDGKVIKLTNYGAFVDVGGLQGLLHISEMSLGRIKHPSEVMKEGDTIKVKVLKIDKRKKRISLGRRDLLPNPWSEIKDKFKPGMVVEGVVVRTAEFGAFIKLDDYFEGLAHISELVDNKISHAKEVFSAGDKVNVYIMNIDRKNKRIKLSVRRAADAQRKAEVAEFMKAQGDLENVFASQLQQALAESELDLPSKEETEKSEETSEPETPVEKTEDTEKPEEVEEEPEVVAESEPEPEPAVEPEAEVKEESADAEETEPEVKAEEEPAVAEETTSEESPEENPDTETEATEKPAESSLTDPGENGTPL